MALWFWALLFVFSIVECSPYSVYEGSNLEPGAWTRGEEGPESFAREETYPTKYDLDEGDEYFGDDVNSVVLPEKRGGRLPVAFICSPKTADCRNGGRGPKITPLKSRKFAMCVCLCPNQLKGAQCTKV